MSPRKPPPASSGQRADRPDRVPRHRRLRRPAARPRGGPRRRADGRQPAGSARRPAAADAGDADRGRCARARHPGADARRACAPTCAREELARFDPDGIVLVAYGQIVPADLLRIGRRPPLNVHPSLLPRHRGAAPVAGTILAGDPEGGVTLMVMTEELDAGPIVARWPVTLVGQRDDAGARGEAGGPRRRGRPAGPPAVGPWGDRDRASGRSRRDPRPSVHARGRLDRLAPAGGRDRPAGARASALAGRVDDDRRPPPPRPPRPPGGGRRRRHDRRADAGGAAVRRVRRRRARARDRAAGGPPVDAGRGLASRTGPRAHPPRDRPPGGGPPLARRPGRRRVASSSPFVSPGRWSRFSTPQTPSIFSASRASLFRILRVRDLATQDEDPALGAEVDRSLRHLRIAEEDRLGAVAQGHVVGRGDAAAALRQGLELALGGASSRSARRARPRGSRGERWRSPGRRAGPAAPVRGPGRGGRRRPRRSHPPRSRCPAPRASPVPAARRPCAPERARRPV